MNLKKSKKTLEVGGWGNCPIFVNIIFFVFGEHSNVNNVINAPPMP